MIRGCLCGRRGEEEGGENKGRSKFLGVPLLGLDLALCVRTRDGEIIFLTVLAGVWGRLSVSCCRAGFLDLWIMIWFFSPGLGRQKCVVSGR